MTPEKQRIAIAEWCGYTKQGGLWLRPDGGRVGSYGLECDIPDYLSDLNEIAKARRCIIAEDDRSRKVAFLNHLRAILEKQNKRATSDYDLLDANAGQIAEALLRTIGRWEEA